jgi:L-lactate permease
VAGFYLGPYLPDVLASVLAMVAFILVNKVWQPPPRETSDGVMPLLATAQPLSRRQVLDAWTPLVVLIVVIGFWGSPYGTKLLSSTDFPVVWPGLHEVVVRVYPVVPAPRPLAAIWNVNWLSGAGTGIVVAAAATALLTSGRRAPSVFVQALLQSLRQLKFALIVAVTIVMMAFIMNYGGLVTSIGIVVAGTGVLFPFFSAFIGGIGVFTTGSDTSSSLLFGGIQTTAAQQAGFPPILAAGTNISGGATFKMVSPLELAVATSAGGLAGREGDLFRALIPWTLGFCAFIGLIALLQAHVLAFVIP